VPRSMIGTERLPLAQYGPCEVNVTMFSLGLMGRYQAARGGAELEQVGSKAYCVIVAHRPAADAALAGRILTGQGSAAISLTGAPATPIIRIPDHALFAPAGATIRVASLPRSRGPIIAGRYS